MAERLFTVDQNSIPEREVYLSLLAVEIYGYSKFHKQKDYLSYPSEISIQYLKYKEDYLKYFQTCLRRYKGKALDEFIGPKREIIEGLIDEDIQKSIDNAVELIFEDFEDFDFKSPKGKHLKINLFSDDNKHATSYVRGLHSDMIAASKNQSKVLFTPVFGKTRLNNFEKKVEAIGESGLKRVALEFAEKRALMDGEKYRFKKLVSGISVACKDNFLNSKTGEPKRDLRTEKIADLAKEIINGYEIIGKTNYLIDESQYKKAVEGHIKAKMEKYSKSNSK